MNRRPDIYQEVTDRIIVALEQGTVPWRRPWASLGGPRNLSDRPYRGVNVFLLALAGYGDPRWGTYTMLRAHGGQVRRGERGTRVILWKPVIREDANGDQSAAYLLLKTYTVFNAEQCDGLPELERPETAFEPHEHAEEIIAGMQRRPAIVHGGDRAAYSPERDMVWLPAPEAFEESAAYYCTAFHELTHATGHESRLDRLEPATFGTDPYAREELIAEMGAAMLAGTAGLETRFDKSASYIAGWLRRLRDDRKLVVQAAAQAQKAADYVLGTTFEEGAGTAPASSNLAVAA